MSASKYNLRQPLRQPAAVLNSQARPICVFLCLLLLAFCSPGQPRLPDHTYSLKVTGASQTHEQQIRAHIEDVSLDGNLEHQLSEVHTLAAISLQALGYYNAKITSRHASYKQHTAIELFVDAGRPVIVSAIDLNILGEAGTSHEFLEILQELPIREKQVLDHGNYERAKDLLYSHARNLGFFDAKFVRSQVRISEKRRDAKIVIDFDSGLRHNIGKINYNTQLFDQSFLSRWQPFETGIPYRASLAATLTRNLQNSGYFKYVSVKPDFKAAGKNIMPLTVDLTPASENIMSLGAGYATDTELRLKGSWLRPHHNKKGHTLKGSTSLSRLRQEFSASYQIPHKRRSDHGKYTLDIGLLNHQSGDTISQLRTANITDSRVLNNGWHRDVFLRLENENTEADNSRTNLLLPGFSFSRTLSDGSIHPDNGTFISLRMFGGSTKLLSDINMFKITASAKKLFSWNQKHYFVARADLGFLKSSKFSRIAPSHRFYTGGDNSVRGFAYQSIAPVNENNETTGGKYLTNASVEYNYYFKDRWALALFADSGRAFNDSGDPYKVGVGAGIRWLSPVGPLRIDVGVGVSEENRPVRIHLAIGPQL